MTYNCLFTVLTDTSLVDDTLNHATAMAQAYDAHLDVLCLGVDRSQSGYYYAGASAIVLQETITRAHEDAQEIEAKVKSYLSGSTVRWGAEIGVAQIADLARHVAGRARFSDLVILPRPYGEDRGAELEAVVEAAMFDGHVPTVVLPDNVSPVPNPKNVIVAWNESTEALTAVRAAMPLLKDADQVRVVVVDPPSRGPNRSDPGGQLSQFLARHGVRVEIDILSKSLPRVAEMLIRQVNDTESDMIVMGAYGHSRFREAIFGGATRFMLENTPVPVLMAR